MNIIKLLRELPFTLMAMITVISIIGFCVLYSAAGGNINPWCFKQMLHFAIFFPLAIAIAMVETKIIYRFALIFYFFILLMLVGVELFGSSAMGGQRWINLGIAKVQPSEPAKIAIVLMLARYFHLVEFTKLNRLYMLLPPIIGVMLPAILIIKQPDLGTGMVVLIVSTIMFFAAGVGIWKFIIAGIGIIGSAPLIWHMMYDYQKRRILMFLNPSEDPLGSGYNIIQSKIAIGSGGMFGKGLTSGTQSQLEFLPEHQTDFIFASLAEELGFMGGVILLLLYFAVILISLSISVNCKNTFGKMVVIGITSIFFSHVFINIAMVMGMLPVVGVPLPLISYGGTMMGSMLIGFGLIMNMEVNRSKQLF